MADFLRVVDDMPPELFNFCLFCLVWFVWAITRIDLERVLSDVGYQCRKHDEEDACNFDGNSAEFMWNFVQPDREFLYDVISDDRGRNARTTIH